MRCAVILYLRDTGFNKGRITRCARDPECGVDSDKSKLPCSFLDFLLSSKCSSGAWHLVSNKKSRLQEAVEICLSGWQDSNLRPPGPKPGAMTGLRYAPFGCI